MGIFDKIKHAIWGHEAQAAAQPADTTVTTASLGAPQATTGVTPDVSTQANDPVLRDVAAAGVQPVSKPATIETAQNSGATTPAVDVAAQLDRMVAANGQKLDWRHSIVDLMKALGMDASLAERKELAGELSYSGDMQDSARMNMFLHKALLKRLAENGGTVPKELLD